MGPTMKNQALSSENHHVIFALRNREINGVQIQQKESVKYLGLYLDPKLTWKYHLKQNASRVKQKIRKMYWLVGRH